ncbi:MAG TPA: hypothetical protein DEO54_09545 [Rikenellaceae bacterium]|nr:MAG: hypothetical protein A2X20_08820 [Bacteroidetes bacterium GWE2_40_15]HBZ26457.1 hypothetical protein [Rikenellaceae bacterium]
MIDFTELPEDGVKFEQLIRELLILEGFETHWTGVGQDGGRDLVVTEKLKGEISEYERKWLISCKHTANSGKSLGREQAGNISEDCKAIGAEGYILVCSTQPTASLVTRLSEIEQKQNIITKFWDSIEIEKRLSKPNTFNLIHTFFPESSKRYKWRIYNAFSPAFWAANYKDYFFYLSCRHSNTYPYLESVETIVSLIEKIPIYKDKEYGWYTHYLRLRAVYYDDKHCTHIAYIDYIFPKGVNKKGVLNPKKLNDLLFKAFTKKEHKVMNLPSWDILYLEESTGSDSFQLDHKRYYEPYLKEFEQGNARREFLHDLVFQIEMMENLSSKV